MKIQFCVEKNEKCNLGGIICKKALKICFGWKKQ